MNIENTTDFSSYLRSITDEDHQEEEKFYMDRNDYDFCKSEYTKQYNTYITDRACMFLIWRCNLDGCDLNDFFRENVATIEIANERYTPKQMQELHTMYPGR